MIRSYRVLLKYLLFYFNTCSLWKDQLMLHEVHSVLFTVSDVDGVIFERV